METDIIIIAHMYNSFFFKSQLRDCRKLQFLAKLNTPPWERMTNSVSDVFQAVFRSLECRAIHDTTYAKMLLYVSQ